VDRCSHDGRDVRSGGPIGKGVELLPVTAKRTEFQPKGFRLLLRAARQNAEFPLLARGPTMKKMFPVIVLLLSGCASVERLRPDIEAKVPPSRLEEIAYINGLRRAFTLQAREGQEQEGQICYDGEGLKRFNPELSEGYALHDEKHEQLSQERTAAGENRPQRNNQIARNSCVFFQAAPEDKTVRRDEMLDYLEAGFGLTDIYCQRFFIVANQSAQKRKFQRDSFTTVGGLVNTVLSLAKAGETAIGIVGAGFTGLDSSYKNIDNAFLVAPELSHVRDLVKAAQRDYRAEAFKAAKIPRSYAGARSIIEDYAGFCSYTGMKELVDDSLADQTKDLNKRAERTDADETKPTGDAAPAAPNASPEGTPSPAKEERPAGSRPVPTPAPQR
jgi:hypothetical protein